ncbi:hypothetical protein FOA52_005805 [Chlamydomonas sp. UWO 241]|nr:hypothetical protein FOA52_005805 [Chlamydomonas sp. UWO 241]
MIGKRDTGKSVLVKDLLYHQRDLPIGTVISPTEQANSFFGSIVPPLFIHNEYTPEVIGNVVKRQKQMLNAIKNKGQTNLDPRAFLVLDDCLYDESWTKDKNIRLLFMNGRHYNIMFVITMQYPLGIKPNLRTQIDYVFILRENLINNRKRIWENYAGMFPTFDCFCQVLDQCTENYECLVIHNNAKSNRLEDQVFWYKADTHPPFQIGDRQFWVMSANLASASANEDDEDEMFDLETHRSTKKNSMTLSVHKQGGEGEAGGRSTWYK